MKKHFNKIVAACLLLLVTLFSLASCKDPMTEDGNIDYQKADLSKYISLSEKEYEKNTVTLSTDYLVDDSDVDEQINSELFKKKTKIGTKITDSKIENGDSAFIYYEGYVDGAAFEGGSNTSKTTPHELIIGSGAFIDGFEEGLIGVVPNETSRENPHVLSLKFPETYSNNPDLAGKDVEFRVWVEYAMRYNVTDQPIKRGDSAFIYYTGYLNGKPFDGGSNENDEKPYELSIGSGRFIDGFEEGLLGVIPNDTDKEKPFELTLRFPEDYGVAELNGQEVIFKVRIEYTVQYSIPQLSDEYVKDSLKYDGSAAEYRAELKASMQEELDEKAKSEALSAVISKLIEAAEIKELPEVSVEYWYDEYVKKFESDMEYYTAYGYKFDSFEDFVQQYLGLKDGENWQDETRELARGMVETELLYNLIAKQQNFTVSDEEYDKQLDELVKQYSSSTKVYTKDEIEEQLGKDYIRKNILFEKVENLLMKNCTIEYKD